MKLIILLLTTIFCQISAVNNYAQDTEISLNLENATLSEVFRSIEKQTEFVFLYSNEEINTNRKVNIRAANESIYDILDKVLVNYNYKIENRQILLFPKAVQQSTRNITGTVVDDFGEPVIGANIIVKGIQSGTVTDIDGRFVLDIPAGGDVILLVSYIGYIQREIKVGSDNILHIVLNEDTQKLDEVVVVGYGTQKRVNLTGAISTVSSEKIAKANRPDMTSALAGTLPGVRTVQKSGRPGADGSEIDIRGFGEPLTIVDGIERPFSQLDPNEVESVTVLKDASASVYGFKGSNGVILVTTKKGSEGKAQVNYNFNYGFQKITDYPKYMNGVDYATYMDEARLNIGESVIYGKDRIAAIAAGTDPDYANTDWNKALLRNNAPSQQHNLNISGGSQNTKYFMSVGYLDQDGIIKTKDNFKRYNIRSNISTKLFNNLTVDMQVGGRSERQDSPNSFSGEGEEGTDAFAFGVFKALAMAIPTYKVYANDNPNYYQFINGSSINPVAAVDRDLVGTYFNQYDEFNGQLGLNYELPWVKGLSVKALIAYDRQWRSVKDHAKAWSLYTYNTVEEAYSESVQRAITTLEEAREENSIFNQQYSINYANVFGKHDISAMVLLERREYEHKEMYVKGEIDVTTLPELDAANSANLQSGGKSNKQAYMGIVGRINYVYDGKYLAEFSFREDGSYKFQKGSRWGCFPAISAGWRISEESFFRNNISIFDNVKIRASYGKVGNDTDADAANFLSGYRYPGLYSHFVVGDNNVVIGAEDKGLTNPFLTWYEVAMTNVGVDASLWNNKLYMEFEWFYRKRTGILAKRNVSLPSIFGATFPQENLNSDDNRGIELVLGTKQRLGDFQLDVKGTFSYSRARYLYQEQAEAGNDYKYWRGPDGDDLNSPHRWTNMDWGYTALGQFQSYEEILSAPIQDGQGNLTLLPGDIRYKDVNGDGVIDDLDKTPIGRSTTPDIFFGLNIGVNYKDFDLTLFFQGATNYTYPIGYKQPFVQGGMGGGYEMFTDRWHRANPEDPTSEWIPGRYPALRPTGYDGNGETSTFWNINATYLRLKTIDFGYTLPRAITSKAGMQRVRVYVNAYNLFTFKNSALKGIDPEGESNYGLFYPQMKSFNLGVNVTF
ncbi:MAG: TonB-dependent receptor [Tannerellaceae bacterium]|nr:TonB-dependent receptor [Tannerellaceae bacterium]